MSATHESDVPAKPASGGGRGAPALAALDLGTNNCRLLIARPRGAELEIVDSFARMVRLGEGLSASGRLAEPAIERALKALGRCAAKMARYRIACMRAVATEACRRAENGPEFVRRARAETGIALEIIGRDEEARLAALGCAGLIDRTQRRALILDIGGGSTELTWLDLEARAEHPTLVAWTSLPIGVVTLAEARPADRVSTEEFAQMAALVQGLLRPFDAAHGIGREVVRGGVQMIGGSGTVTTLAAVHLGLRRYERARVDGLAIDFADLRGVSAELAAMSCRERARLATVGPGRADLVVAGAAILQAVMDLWPAGRLRVADRGLREGILRGMVAAESVAASAQ